MTEQVIQSHLKTHHNSKTSRFGQEHGEEVNHVQAPFIAAQKRTN
jgi:hypothetical protein